MRRTGSTLAALVAVTAAVTATTLVVTHGADAATTVRVTRWLDGDTVVTTAGTVRLIGIDTPERGRCGSAAATALARRIAPAGSTVSLANPSSVRDKDAYGRLLRYVDRGARDLGEAPVRHGAWARYDSRDGYQWHPRQALYRRLDRATGTWCVSGPATGSVTAPVAPLGRDCPSYAPIKGNESSMIYHRPGQAYYDVTVPEACFRDAASAEAAGYRPAKV